MIHEMGMKRLERVNQYIIENIEQGYFQNMPMALYEAFVHVPILETDRSHHAGGLNLTEELKEQVVSNIANFILEVE